MLYKLKGYPEDWIEKRMRGIAIRMGDFELILTMLGEKTTAEIHRDNDTKSMPRLKDDARVGGQIAGTARKQIERKLRRSIVTKDNFFLSKNKKRLK